MFRVHMATCFIGIHSPPTHCNADLIIFYSENKAVGKCGCFKTSSVANEINANEKYTKWLLQCVVRPTKINVINE